MTAPALLDIWTVFIEIRQYEKRRKHLQYSRITVRRRIVLRTLVLRA